MSMSKHVSPAIGIDLGFTTTRLETKGDAFGCEFVTPSVVSIIGGNILIGDAAKRAQLEAGTVSGVNRLLGRQTYEPSVKMDSKLKRRTYKVTSGKHAKAMIELDGSRKIYPEFIAALILNKSKKYADEYFQDEINDVVVTVPASFNDAQRRATRDAAMIAGFKHIRLLNKPSAAAIAHVFDTQVVSKNLLVFCFGAGCVDASVISVSENGGLTVLATRGNNTLGSLDIDWLLVPWAVKKVKDQFPQFVPNEIDRERIRLACEAAKIELSEEKEAIVELKEPAVQCIINRHQFKQFTKSFFDEMADLIGQAVLDAGVTIDQVLLVGASCRMPEVKKVMDNLFPNQQPDYFWLCGHDRARGASILADALQKQEDPYVLKDLSPFRFTFYIPYSCANLSEGETLTLKEANSPAPSPLPLVSAKYKDPRLERITTIFLREESSNLAKPKIIGVIRIDRGRLAHLPSTVRGQMIYHIGARIDRNGIMKVGFGFQAHQRIRSELTVNIVCRDGRMTEKEIRTVQDQVANAM